MLYHTTCQWVKKCDENPLNISHYVTKKGLKYLIGKGKWRFTSEAQKRFPQTRPMREMSFGDINGDGFLDMLGLVAKNNNPKLWLNRIN